MARTPKTPAIQPAIELPPEKEPPPMPRERDVEKVKKAEKKRLQKSATQTVFTSRWLGEPTLLSQRLSGA